MSKVRNEEFLSPPVDGVDDTSVKTAHLLESANGKVERTPVAGRALVGNDGFDGLAVTLDPDLLAAQALVVLSRVNCN